MSSLDIRLHIEALPEDHIFTTRDLLLYARRNTVDQCLHKLVKEGVIQRLARGVFVQVITESITAEAIVAAKLKGFDKKLLDNQSRVDERVLRKRRGEDTLRYRSDGGSGSFDTVFGRITVSYLSPRKQRLLNSRDGEIVSFIWQRKRNGLDPEAAHGELPRLDKYEMQDLRANIRWMPHWMGDIHVVRNMPPHVRDLLSRELYSYRQAEIAQSLSVRDAS